MFKAFRKKKKIIYAPATGELIAIEKVNDPVFSSKAMGGGFAINPNDGAVFAPIEGTVTSVFPTKHAIGLVDSDGTEVLVHIGIDTVDLKGEGFEVFVKEGDAVSKDTKLAEVDLAYLKAQQKGQSIIVIFTNLDDRQRISEQSTVSAGTQVGEY